MHFLNQILLSKLPDFGEIESWGETIVGQIIAMIVMFMVAKNLARFKIGGIVVAMVLGGAVTFAVQNWEQVSGWVEAILNKL